MAHLRYSLILYVLLLVVVGCRKHDEPLKWEYVNFSNMTSDLVYINCSDDDYFLEANGFNDFFSWWKVILPGETNETNNRIYEGKFLYILLYKSETLKKYTREELVENDIADFRAQYSYEQLEAMDFTITYTGD